MVDIKKFLAYDKLDDELLDMIIEIIDKCVREAGHNAPKLYDPIPEEEVADWEKRHNVKLPEDYRWIITHVGKYYPDYSISDIKDNECFTLDPKPDERGNYPVYEYSFELGCNGCTFSYVLGLHDYDYGKVYELCGDEVWEWDRSSRESVDEALLGCMIEMEESDKNNGIYSGIENYHNYYYDNFLTFYKEALAKEYDYVCVDHFEDIEETVVDYLLEDTCWEVESEQTYWVDSEGNREKENAKDLIDHVHFHAFPDTYINADDRKIFYVFIDFLFSEFDLKNNKFYNKLGTEVTKDYILEKWNKDKNSYFSKLRGIVNNFI